MMLMLSWIGYVRMRGGQAMDLDWVEMVLERERWRRERPPISRVWPAVHRRETSGRGGRGGRRPTA